MREAARAFTGWTIENGQAAWHADQHDNGDKNVLGQHGNFGAADIVRICLEQEATPYFITRKLFRFLVSETIEPSAELLEPLASALRTSDYDFRGLVEKVLRSNLFFSTQAYRTRVKTPVDFALGIVRGLEAHVPSASHERLMGTSQLASALDGLGQRLFFPPSVAGWEMGRAWLNSQTFLLRQNLALALTSTTDDRFGRRADPAGLLRRHGRQNGTEPVDFLLRLFVQDDVAEQTRQRLNQYMATAATQSYPFFWQPEEAADQRSAPCATWCCACPSFSSIE